MSQIFLDFRPAEVVCNKELYISYYAYNPQSDTKNHKPRTVAPPLSIMNYLISLSSFPRDYYIFLQIIFLVRGFIILVTLVRLGLRCVMTCIFPSPTNFIRLRTVELLICLIAVSLLNLFAILRAISLWI